MAVDGGTRVRLLLFAPRGADLDTFTPRVADACRQVTSDVSGRALDNAKDASDRGKPSAFAETFRLLAANVEHLAASSETRSILVMSAYRGDGRTLTVQNLGRALAELGHHVVTVEMVANSNGHGRRFGFGATAVNGAGHPSPGPVPANTNGAGRDAPSPSSVSMNVTRGDATTLREMLAALRPLSDFVLIDSAPCLSNADAFLLAPLVDGVIYVVRRRPQDAAAQRQIQSQLTRLGARVLGAVFNEA
ncbi:MAG: hypothetical protein ACRDIY_20850 [Chloroflexota bacterium]